MTPKFHSLQIKNIRKETKSCVSINFEIPQELQADFRYQSGQYLTLRSKINDEDVRRSYSLCSAPSDHEWRVAIKQVENGVFSTFAVNDLKEGQFIDVMNPMGNFKLETALNHTKSYALFAAGSGVTPIFSILKSILREEPNSHVTMFYGNQGFSEVIFREELENLKLPDIINRVSQAHKGWHSPVEELILNSVRVVKGSISDVVEIDNWYKERIIVIGDAAHAMNPFFGGQGVGTAVEDAYILAKLIEKHDGDYKLAFPTLEKLRKARTTKIASRARKNCDRSTIQYSKLLLKLRNKAFSTLTFLTPERKLNEFISFDVEEEINKIK